MRPDRGGTAGPAPAPLAAAPTRRATYARRPDPTARGPHPAPPPEAGSPAPPAAAPNRAPPAPATPPSGRWLAARDTDGHRRGAPGGGSSAAARPRRSSGTAPASSSASPSGSDPTPRSSSRHDPRSGPSHPGAPGSAPSPSPPPRRPRWPGSPRPGRPSRRPPPPASTASPSPTGPPRAARAAASARPGAPLFLDPVEAPHHRLQPPLQHQPRGRQRRPAVVGQGAAHRGAVALNRSRLQVVTALDLALDRPHPADPLLQLLLGVPIGLVDRLGRLAEVVEVAELVRYAVERHLDRLADRVLAVGDHASDRHLQRLLDFGDEPGQVIPGR